MELIHEYMKLRTELGCQCLFSDCPAELLLDILPDPSLSLQLIPKTQRNQALQDCRNMSEHLVNTECTETNSLGINHMEGGWPKDMNPVEIEQTIRFRKKLEKEESYINSILQLGNVMEHCIRQNNAVDICQEFFEKDKEEEEEVPGKSRDAVCQDH